MNCGNRGPASWIITVLLWVHLVSLTGATQTYCSSQNTGSTPANYDLYQSNGLCSGHCSGYSYAVVQGYDCWCSNDEPTTKDSVGDCSSACPGYGYEQCGESDKGLFGYIYLGTSSLTTSSGSSSSTSSFVSSSSSSSSSISNSPSSSSSSSSFPSTLPVSSTTSSSSSSLSASASPSSSSTSSLAGSSSTTPSSSSNTPISSSSSGWSSSAPSSSSMKSSLISSSTAVSSSVMSSSSSSTSLSSSSTSTSSSSTSTSSSSISTASASTSSSSSSASTSSSSILSERTSSSSTSMSSPSSSYSPSTSSDGLLTSLLYSVQTVTASPTAGGSSSDYVLTTQVITTIYSTPTGQTSSGTNSNHTSPQNSGSDAKGFWAPPGKIAGTFVAVGVVVACLALFVLLFWYRRRHRKDEDFERRYNDVVAPVCSNASIGPASTASPNGFIYADEKGIQGAPPSSEKNDKRISQTTSLADSESGAVPEDGPVVVDQRLDPRQMFMMQWENGGSKVSLADDVDYSRKVLRVINE
ncbi:LANO_0F09164g1_1 [Lachancea nothofagi CBS 11611]|uniref:LANO_0F09164g1_1 n=1 Tax=Lachancea nothofagi CBS 11611 TaxID=1266666 RepID=A0A1G4K9V7_9SACH|nr:LANO_0F09164g1_1 [Lachancea nothofagi CBS 11611]